MNYNIKSRDDLKAVIGFLEDEVAEQGQRLSDHASLFYGIYRPVNIARDLVKEVVTSEEFRSNLLTATIGITTGYVAKKLFVRTKKSLLKMMAGNFLQYAIANLIVNPNRILKSVVMPFLEFFSGEGGKENQKKTP